jgi:hypothetical protein
MAQKMSPERKIKRIFESMYVLVCAVMGIRVEAFEKNRFLWCLNDGRAIEHAETFIQADVQTNVKTLLISLAGSTLVIGGEMRSTLTLLCTSAPVVRS